MKTIQEQISQLEQEFKEKLEALKKLAKQEESFKFKKGDWLFTKWDYNNNEAIDLIKFYRTKDQDTFIYSEFYRIENNHALDLTDSSSSMDFYYRDSRRTDVRLATNSEIEEILMGVAIKKGLVAGQKIKCPNGVDSFAPEYTLASNTYNYVPAYQDFCCGMYIIYTKYGWAEIVKKEELPIILGYKGELVYEGKSIKYGCKEYTKSQFTNLWDVLDRFGIQSFKIKEGEVTSLQIKQIIKNS